MMAPWVQQVWREPGALSSWAEGVVNAIGPLVDDPDALGPVLARIASMLDRAPVAPVRLPGCITPRIIPVDRQHPTGWKGGLIRATWRENPDAPGAVFVDGDTALDPPVARAVDAAIASDPACVWTCACRMWGAARSDVVEAHVRPEQVEAVKATMRWNPDDEWARPGVLRVKPRPAGCYAHRVIENGKARWGRLDDDRVDGFGLGCTYLPWRLCEAVERRGAWDRLVFPRDDLVLSMIAAEEGVGARLVPGVEVMHLHWDAGAV